MSVTIASLTSLGNVVTVNVYNKHSVPKLVTISLRVSVDGQLLDLTSLQTQIPANTTTPVFLHAPGEVEFIADSPDPTILAE